MEKIVTPLRYIPYRRADIVEMCLAEGHLDDAQHPLFRQFANSLAAMVHTEHHTLLEDLKRAYDYLNPQNELRESHLLTMPDHDFKTTLLQVLEKANFEQLTEQDLQAALKEASLFKVRLHVDFSQFKEALVFARGQTQRTEEVSWLWGRFRKNITFTHFKRVALYLRLPAQDNQPEHICLKLFQDVPKSDIEMLFPETEVKMRTIDKLFIGIPAVVSGGIVLSTKMGTTLLLLGSLFGFWLGLHADPVTLNKASVLALLAGTGALGGYVWKQVKNFRTRKLKFVQALTRNLYFKNLANNTSVLYQLIDDAEEEESKEILLAYYFLLISEEALTAQQLDTLIENWFAKHWHYELDFEISDALNKLERFNLASAQGGKWQAVSLEDSVRNTTF